MAGNSLLVKELVSPKIVCTLINELIIKNWGETNHSKMIAKLAANYIFAIKKGIKHDKFINEFQDWVISAIHSLEAGDSKKKDHNMNTKYKYSTNDPGHPNGLD